jgi:hypothetical protein
VRVILTRDGLIQSKNWSLLKAMNFCTGSGRHILNYEKQNMMK